MDAPLEWYRTVDEFLQQLGLERCWSDACLWIWRKDGQVRGAISGHVDDFLFAGSDSDSEWQSINKRIQEKFKWSDWEESVFTQCGVQVKQTPEGFELSQPQYLETVAEIPINATRRKEKQAPITEHERSRLRTLLGAVSWHAQQVAPQWSAEVSLLLSEVAKGTVETVIKSNILLSNAKAQKNHIMRIHRHETEEMVLYAWVDAANQNRADGGSTQGIFIGMGPSSLLRGDVGAISPIAWHSNKIDRVCRSPGAAETQAAVNGEDALYFARYQWAEMCHGSDLVRRPNDLVQKVPGCLVTDSRNVYDKLQTEVLTVKGAEKKANLELLGLKESQQQTGVIVRWVHSEAQLGNSLTKSGGSKEIEMFYSMGHRWRIVEDDQMRSARRRKADGVEPLQSQHNPHSTTTEQPNNNTEHHHPTSGDLE